MPSSVICTATDGVDGIQGVGWFDRFGLRERLQRWHLCVNNFGRIDTGGWLAWGLYDNSHGLDGALGNQPLLFNNIAEEPVLHQAWVFVDRPADNHGEGLAFGFRTDALFGADANELQTFGDGSWDADWDTSGQYGFAIPQLYGEMALGKTRVRLGHFLSMFGYKQVQAPAHFFYSHTYSNTYNTPFTQTGLTIQRDWTDRLTTMVMRTGGWDSGFANDNDGKVTSAGVQWSSGDRFSVFSGLAWGDPGDVPTSESDVYLHNLVVQVGLTQRLRYIVDHTFQTRRSELAQAGETAYKQYGMGNFLIWQWSERFGLGARYEWFYVGTGVGPPLGSVAATPGSHVQALTFACNIRLRRVLLKPEFRYDWVDFDGVTLGGPFDEGQRRSQATWGLQSVLQW